VLHNTDDFLKKETQERFQQIIPFPNEIENEDCIHSYLYLKENILGGM